MEEITVKMTSTDGTEDCDAECNIECIIAEERNPHGQIFYLIKWEGLRLSRPTWEPESKFAEHGDLLTQWEAEKNAATLLGSESPFDVNDYYEAVEASEDERCERESLMEVTARKEEVETYPDPDLQIVDTVDDRGQEVAPTKRNQRPQGPEPRGAGRLLDATGSALEQAKFSACWDDHKETPLFVHLHRCETFEHFFAQLRRNRPTRFQHRKIGAAELRLVNAKFSHVAESPNCTILSKDGEAEFDNLIDGLRQFEPGFRPRFKVTILAMIRAPM